MIRLGWGAVAAVWVVTLLVIRNAPMFPKETSGTSLASAPLFDMSALAAPLEATKCDLKSKPGEGRKTAR